MSTFSTSVDSRAEEFFELVSKPGTVVWCHPDDLAGFAATLRSLGVAHVAPGAPVPSGAIPLRTNCFLPRGELLALAQPLSSPSYPIFDLTWPPPEPVK